MALKLLQKLPGPDLPSDPYLLRALLRPDSPSDLSSMDPTQQLAPSPELRLVAVEQALIDSKAREIETQKQLASILNGFQQLEALIQKLQPPPTSPKISSTNITPLRSAPIGRPPPPALPSEYNRDRSQGQAFLTSCQTYI